MESPTEKLTTRVAEPIVIRLKSNPTTGIGWQAVYDAEAVTLVRKNFERGGAGIGAGGEEVLTFEATRPGRVSITLELRRPTDRGARETRTYDVTVEP